MSRTPSLHLNLTESAKEESFESSDTRIFDILKSACRQYEIYEQKNISDLAELRDVIESGESDSNSHRIWDFPLGVALCNQ